MDRRTFLKVAGAGSLAFAANCTSQPAKTIYSLVHHPEGLVTGKATWYASTCRECPAGCGVVAKNREGRVVKLEGNPLHPINRGRLCARGQAALQGIYNPDRLQTPLRKSTSGKWEPLGFQQAEALLRAKLAETAASGRIFFLSEIIGDSLAALIQLFLQRWGGGQLVLFEPFAYESQRHANDKVFGFKGLPTYHLHKADFLLGLGADFLDTWISPVEYAWKFKEFHRLQGSSKAVFCHASPCCTLTGANADLWLPTSPGSEHFLAAALVREALKAGKGNHLPPALQASLEKITSPHTLEKAAAVCGLDLDQVRRVAARLLQARRPLILGTATAAMGRNSLQVDVLANILNLLCDPELSLVDLQHRPRVDRTATRGEVVEFFSRLRHQEAGVLLLHNVNPVYSLQDRGVVADALSRQSLFKVSFSNFIDETAEMADLIFPLRLPLESWDEYAAKEGLTGTLQPAMGGLTRAPGLGDLLLRLTYGSKGPFDNYRAFLYFQLVQRREIGARREWLRALQRGGVFSRAKKPAGGFPLPTPSSLEAILTVEAATSSEGPILLAASSMRFFDGRGANRPWLCEVPDPLSQVAWQTPILAHPETLKKHSIKTGEIVRLTSPWGSLEAPVLDVAWVQPEVMLISQGQGHWRYGRYATGVGADPLVLLPPGVDGESGAPIYAAPVSLAATGRRLDLARMDGSRSQHQRKIAVSLPLQDLNKRPPHRHGRGLGMWEYPLVLPLPEAYDRRRRDFYPPHPHADYRWAMTVDLDRCIGCSACAVACYAENNVGIVGEQRVIEGREMAWLQVQRYHDLHHPERLIFLPMLCQHCDNAPCESVCPVYAPHHSKEGLNNQIYNRCIGTRFCSQNCPYKVRRFNWFTWKWPHPLDLQLNPDVTVRSKGVMEKCSFCIQRIKAAHDQAKNENRKIADGEVVPACAQTCPTGVFTFGNLMDPHSRVRQQVEDKRAYQVLGYLNTKPAVIYLMKVIQDL